MAETEPSGAYDPAAAAERWSKAWKDAGLFEADPEAPGEAFSIVIPPPNITGSLHMGHALNNTLQDILVRYKRMDGYNVLWVPGTDHAGIATQWVVRRQLEAQGVDYRSLGREGFVEKVWAWKGVSGGRITHQLAKLGISADWSRERFTLDPNLTRAVSEHFVRLYEDGLIYRGERLVNWDPADQTAVSDLEVEHDENVTGEMFEFAYLMSDGSGEIVVATTRPETMLGDTAIAVHPDDPRHADKIGKTVDHPFLDRKIPIIADAILVDPALGTGAVKITPAHDPNDFECGLRHDLPRVTILTLDGKINDNGGPFAGLDRFEARKAVKAALAEAGLARAERPHIMSIGRSQRSGAIIEPMISTQWFVKMKPLATPALEAVRNGYTRFVPKNWENTYYAWLTDIRDWCISRQLWWGHRIPAWYCASCGATHVAVSAPEACATCGGLSLRQDEDVLDTWFSSALWPFSVMGWPERTADLQRYYPTTVLVTAFDIIFFWVARMMFAGIHLTGTVPFRDVYIHALIRDKNGDKMSKTKGNVVDPLETIDKYGADAFRFTLCAFAAQGRDILWDEARVDGYRRFCTKVWQALRFCLMNAEGYDPAGPMDPGPYENWIKARAGAAVARVRAALDSYKFNDAAGEIYAFTWNELCDWYIELSKGALYGEGVPPARRNAVQHALFESMATVARLVHPIMPFLSEEIWHALPGRSGFVATTAYPLVAEYPSDAAALDQVALLQEIIVAVRQIRGEMELARRVPLELHVPPASGWIDAMAPFAVALSDLAGVTLVPLAERPRGVATAVVRGEELLVPLAGIVDFAAEVRRLAKVITKVEKDVAQLSGRLVSPGFLERAPPEVVAEVEGKVAAARARLETLERSRAALAEAMS
jgi:valyl-tRNA synthetase